MPVTVFRSRGVGWPARALAGVALAATTFTACSPADVTGVTLSSRRVPVVTNCGSWITGVTARDAATNRVDDIGGSESAMSEPEELRRKMPTRNEMCPSVAVDAGSEVEAALKSIMVLKRAGIW